MAYRQVLLAANSTKLQENIIQGPPPRLGDIVYLKRIGLLSPPFKGRVIRVEAATSAEVSHEVDVVEILT